MLSLASKYQRLAALQPLSPKSVASIAAAWDVRMVYESNSIEGSQLSLRDTAYVLSTGLAVEGTVDDHFAIVALGEAWDSLKRRAAEGDDLTEADLLLCYKKLSGNAHPDRDAGLVSTAKSIARVNGWTCTEPEVMGDLFSGLPADSVEKAARIHHRITRHKRSDAHSGLIARLAANFILLSAGYPPISIPTDLRQDYYNALEAADSGDFATWQNFLETQLDRELDTWLEALDPDFLKN